MKETLSSHTDVVLFGKLVEDLTIKTKEKTDKPGFARIYGFSYGGAYYEMAVPVLFLVHGNGTAATQAAVPGPGLDDDDPFYKSLKVWTYDQAEQTMRLDMDSGTFEQLLLADDGEGGPGLSGARVSGARVAGARVSGARVAGARVSGARVSGARVSGARVSGARVSGARISGDASD
ncbi:MAG: pentapeptide repeat-containing protein [Ahrensia sp.]|nr:pentapeptide repeat-containing protein [Ahrensia sp.]